MAADPTRQHHNWQHEDRDLRHPKPIFRVANRVVSGNVLWGRSCDTGPEGNGHLWRQGKAHNHASMHSMRCAAVACETLCAAAGAACPHHQRHHEDRDARQLSSCSAAGRDIPSAQTASRTSAGACKPADVACIISARGPICGPICAALCSSTFDSTTSGTILRQRVSKWSHSAWQAQRTWLGGPKAAPTVSVRAEGGGNRESSRA